jgi:hypothetical protein
MSETPKKFKDLRVADLKIELEKRGLLTSGIKAVLAERLKNALAEEGIDADEFIFDKTASKEAEKDDEQVGTDECKPEAEDNSNCPEKPEAEENEASDAVQEIDEEQGEGDGAEEDNEGEGEEKEAEDDSLNIMVGDEDNLFGEEEKGNGTPASPPRPENVPAKHPFTSRDTLSLSSRSNRPPSENSSMRVNPDETQSVASHDSNTENNKEADQPAGEAGGETAALDMQAKEQAARSRNDADKAKTSRPVVASGRNLWVSGLCQTTRAKDLKELFSKYGKVEGAKVNIEKKSLLISTHTKAQFFISNFFYN